GVGDRADAADAGRGAQDALKGDGLKLNGRARVAGGVADAQDVAQGAAVQDDGRPRRRLDRQVLGQVLGLDENAPGGIDTLRHLDNVEIVRVLNGVAQLR